jgi:hypothetical protein
MKNTLAENMLRIGTKNLNGQSERSLIVKSIMETINQHGLHKEVRKRLMTEQSVPASITLNYDNGLLRFNQFFKGGDLVWDVNATFKGAGSSMTISEITFVPSYSAPAGTAAVVVPLIKPFTFQIPIDSAGGPAVGAAQWQTLQTNWSAGIKLNTKSPEMTKVLAVTDQTKGNAMTMDSLNLVMGANILDALYFYCGAKGWYIGPKKDVATMYAIFSNHDGSSQNS